MSTPLQLRTLRLHRLRIPLRFRFEHAAAVRETADPIVVELTPGAPYAHQCGYGETLARAYVTGETADSVCTDIEQTFVPLLREFSARSFVDVLDFADRLPLQAGGRVMTAARCAVELALIDVAGKIYRRRPSDMAGWLDLPGFGAAGSLHSVPYSGVVIGRSQQRLRWLLRAQRCYGLGDFKLKVAVDGWRERLQAAYAILKDALLQGTASLRVDANGGWALDDVVDALPLLEDCGVCAIEQPLPEQDDGDLPYLSERTSCAIIADESLITLDDARRLLTAGGVQVFNIRIAKNGGLIPSLRLARVAQTADADVQLGCLVGETSLLAAAGVAFLETCPNVRFAEGAYGRWLLRDDITRRPVQFRRGGRIRPRNGFGLGVEVDAAALERLAESPVRTFSLA